MAAESTSPVHGLTQIVKPTAAPSSRNDRKLGVRARAAAQKTRHTPAAAVEWLKYVLPKRSQNGQTARSVADARERRVSSKTRSNPNEKAAVAKPIAKGPSSHGTPTSRAPAKRTVWRGG
jgi:hypothetical protein